MPSHTQNNHDFLILSIGLNAKEAAFVKQFAAQNNGNLHLAKDEMEFLDLARSNQPQIFILGQTKDSDPNYLTWLCRGIVPNAKLILLFSKLSKKEEKRLRASRFAGILMRPLEPQKFVDVCDHALAAKDAKGGNFFDSILNWLPFRRKAA
ncbi:hypothetical protein GF373_07745 [bacterium]|nr:hypothetical protein [bacterium]